MINPSAILHGKILIVDDQEVNILLLQRILNNAGYAAITSTHNPNEVCILHRKNRYDLILLDLVMPCIDGFQVMVDLKTIERENYLPVLAVTSEPAYMLRALQSGAQDFISKPFSIAEVLIRVRNMLEVRMLHMAALHQSKMMESLALRDPLTGLANRRLFAERRSMALAHARRNKNSMAVLYLDVDGFKQINNSLGHAAGDELLKLVAERLLTTVRAVDTVARLGGDEFVVVLWHVSSVDDAVKVAQKVIAAVSQPYVVENHGVCITTSVGISIYPTHGRDEDTLTKNADIALYEAKRAGKNTYRIFAPPEKLGQAHVGSTR